MIRRLIASIVLLAAAGGWTAAPAHAESRLALVIGNSAYREVTALPNPANDAAAVRELLTKAGFEVTPADNLTLSDMRRAVRDFAAAVAERGADTVALVFYAGHGVQVDGENYVVPVDAHIARESDLAIEALRLRDLMNALASVPARTRIVILDACRNNPFADIAQTVGKGLAIVDAPKGSIVSYATAPGSFALDGKGSHSPFTAALLKVAETPGLPIEQAFKQIRLAVTKATDGQQTPWESSSLTSNFAFFGKSDAAAADSPPQTPDGWKQALGKLSADKAYEVVIRYDLVDGYEVFLSLFPDYREVAVIRGLFERRREMIAWFNATTVDTVLAYEAFLARYPDSDLAVTAKRLRDRAENRTRSPNFQAEANAARALSTPAGNQPTVPLPPKAPPVRIVERIVEKVVVKPQVVEKIVEKPVYISRGCTDREPRRPHRPRVRDYYDDEPPRIRVRPRYPRPHFNQRQFYRRHRF